VSARLIGRSGNEARCNLELLGIRPEDWTVDSNWE